MSAADNIENFSLTSPIDPISVTLLLQRAKLALERALPLCWVTGEISGFKRAASGHCYFDLKDDSAQIACVLYRNRAALVGFELKDGAQVELRLRPAIYEPRGSLQFAVEQARLAGIGRLYEAFVRLKAKLEAEGLFADDKKRAIPSIPKCIGLVTSPKAAALADLLRVLRDRWPRAGVILYPASVQGTNAPRELLAALNVANARKDCDVLIIGRGGGSIEDLWAFNDEALTRAVAHSNIPIVSAVGHETDFSLCDFAADARAPTPTAAAIMVTPEREALVLLAGDLAQRITDAMRSRLDRLGERLDRTGERLHSSRALIAPWREALLRLHSRLHRAISATAPKRLVRLTYARQRLLLSLQRAPGVAVEVQSLDRRLAAAMNRIVSSRHTRLQSCAQSLDLLNPANVLERGYALVFDSTGVPVTDAAALDANDALQIRLKSGRIEATVNLIVSDRN